MMFSVDKKRDFELYPDTNEVKVGGKHTKLSPKEMGVIQMLNERQGSTVSRAELLTAVWGDEYANDQGLTQAVSRLRQVLSESRGTTIKTIPKKGYLLHQPATRNRRIGLPTISVNLNIVLIMLLLLVIVVLVFIKRIEIRVDKLAPEAQEQSISDSN